MVNPFDVCDAVHLDLLTDTWASMCIQSCIVIARLNVRSGFKTTVVSKRNMVIDISGL